MVVRTYNPAPYFDQWMMVDDLVKTGGHITWERLLAQSNEHRIPFTHLASYLDIIYFGNRNLLSLATIWMTQIVHLVVWVLALRRWGPKDLAFQLSAAGLAAYALFSPIQEENFAWGFQPQAGTFASLAFASLAGYARRGRRWLLIAAVVFGCAAEFSLASGLFVWPLLVWLAYGMRLPRPIMGLIAGVGAVMSAVYFIGYHGVAAHSKPFDSLGHPLEIARFIASYFAFSWDASLPNQFEWLGPTEWIALVLVLWAVFESVRSVWTRPWKALEAFCYSNILFTFIWAVITALGRLSLRPQPSLASRYQTVALLFWACAAIAGAARYWNRPAIPFGQFALLVLLVAQAPRFAVYEESARTRQRNATDGYVAVALNTRNQSAMKAVFPETHYLRPWYEFLHTHHWDLDLSLVAEAVERARVRGDFDPSLIGFRVLKTGRCAGFFDEVHAEPNHGIGASGWAWDVESAAVPLRVVIAAEDGATISEAMVNVPRPQVMASNPAIAQLDVGWRAAFDTKPGRTIRAFGILPGGNDACLLLNEFNAPAH